MYIKSNKNQIDYKMNFILKCKTETNFSISILPKQKYFFFEPDGSPTLQVFASRILHHRKRWSMPSCGTQNRWSLLLGANDFDHYANKRSLFRPQDAVACVAPFERRYTSYSTK